MITFGRYKGKSYEEIFTLDQYYCGSVVRRASHPESGSGIRHLADWLRERHPDFEAKEQETMTFGKHQGKSYEEICMLDKRYCEWMLNSSSPGLPSHLLAKWIRERHPDFTAKGDAVWHVSGEVF